MAGMNLPDDQELPGQVGETVQTNRQAARGARQIRGARGL